ncbi:hypothetical protein PG984_008467 [Apiospora sp. TS-2023a]
MHLQDFDRGHLPGSPRKAHPNAYSGGLSLSSLPFPLTSNLSISLPKPDPQESHHTLIFTIAREPYEHFQYADWLPFSWAHWRDVNLFSDVRLSQVPKMIALGKIRSLPELKVSPQ